METDGWITVREDLREHAVARAQNQTWDQVPTHVWDPVQEHLRGWVHARLVAPVYYPVLRAVLQTLWRLAHV
jgi:hypothetical protein